MQIKDNSNQGDESTKLAVSGQGFAPNKNASHSKKSDSAIAPAKTQETESNSSIAPIQNSRRSQVATDVVESATLKQQEEAAKLAADSANSNAVFMEKVRQKAAELDAEAEDADVLEGAQLLRQSRKASRNQTLDFLQEMVASSTNTSIRNIREAVEVMEAEVIS